MRPPLGASSFTALGGSSRCLLRSSPPRRGGRLVNVRMTTAKEFLRALETGGRGKEVETIVDVRARQKREWLEDLDALRRSMRGWLGPVVAAQRAELADKDFTLAEPDLGTYEAPGLEISLAVASQRKTIFVRPRGMNIVGVVRAGASAATGASGRVDIECGVARELLLRFKGPSGTSWVSFSKGKRTLDEGTLFDMLAEVTEMRLR